VQEQEQVYDQDRSRGRRCCRSRNMSKNKTPRCWKNVNRSCITVGAGAGAAVRAKARSGIGAGQRLVREQELVHEQEH
jgi:hypothetical protein